jgi:SAM-dependent methyltransferase
MDWMGYGASRAAYPRRLAEGYYEHFFVGRGLDIGCGDCRVTADCDTWELLHGDGDAQFTSPRFDQPYDWVYTSHLLEHLVCPEIAIRNWWRLVKPGGILFVVVPDEDLFEQGTWPSQFNGGHRWTFTIDKTTSWSPVSISLAPWWPKVLPSAELLLLERFDTNWTPEAVARMRCSVDVEAHIELILRRRV